ncbi:MAG: V-type ATP synthase subunit F [archaeon]
MEIAIIADKDALLGFKLAGITRAAEYSEETIAQDMERFGDAKILILTERVSEAVRNRNLDRKFSGVIVKIPDKAGSTGHAQKEISRLFEEAIGVKLKGE